MTRFLAAMAMIFVTGCQLPGSTQGCSAVHIDWVDFIQIGSTQYFAGQGAPAILAESDLGPVLTHVKFKVDGNVCDPNYRPKDGDAAFLDPGTPVYQVNGQAASQVVAARRDGRIQSYWIYGMQPPATSKESTFATVATNFIDPPA
jgi:hypothetical protein